MAGAHRRHRPWQGVKTMSSSFFRQVFDDLRADVARDGRLLAWVIGGFAICGVIVGVSWGLWAPRDRYQVVQGGYQFLNLNDEARIGGDVVLFLMLLGVVLVATIALWVKGPRRGLLALLVITFGGLTAGFVAWFVGTLVTPAPSGSEIKTLGSVIDIDQRLHSIATILVPVVLAAILYLILSLFSGYGGLWRRSEIRKFSSAQTPAVGPQAPPEGSQDGRSAQAHE